MTDMMRMMKKMHVTTITVIRALPMTMTGLPMNTAINMMRTMQAWPARPIRTLIVSSKVRRIPGYK